MREGYAVQVLYMGEPILTIERNMLCGKSDLTDDDEAGIMDAAEHLRAFVGAGMPKEPLHIGAAVLHTMSGDHVTNGVTVIKVQADKQD